MLEVSPGARELRAERACVKDGRRSGKLWSEREACPAFVEGNAQANAIPIGRVF